MAGGTKKGIIEKMRKQEAYLALLVQYIERNGNIAPKAEAVRRFSSELIDHAVVTKRLHRVIIKAPNLTGAATHHGLECIRNDRWNGERPAWIDSSQHTKE